MNLHIPGLARDIYGPLPGPLPIYKSDMLQFAANNRRAAKALAWLFLALGFAGTTMFLSSTHYSRLALEHYKPVEASSLYGELPPLAEVTASSIGEVKAILEPFNQLKRRYDLPTVQSDDPEVCLKAFTTGRVMDCYGMALSAHEKLSEYQVGSRIWSLTGTDGFGGNGHNVIEYFNTASSRWEMLDPNYSCYFTLKGDETVLSVAELREALLTKPEQLDVRYYKSAVALRDPASLITEFRSLAPSAALLATNDYRERYLNRYALLTPMAGVFDRLPLSATRGLRSFLMGSGDPKLLIEDRFTPRYHLTLLKPLWYLSLTMLVLGLLLPMTLVVGFATRLPRIASFRVKLFATLHGLMPRTQDDIQMGAARADGSSASSRGLPAQSMEATTTVKARYAKV
jgi:hypothetical protein